MGKCVPHLCINDLESFLFLSCHLSQPGLMTRLKAIKSSEFGAEAACVLFRVKVPACTQLGLGALLHFPKFGVQDGEVLE